MIQILIDKINLTFIINDLLVMLATLATALFTAVAAYAAMKSARISKEHLIKQTVQFELESFYKLLDSLEKVHKIVFIQRNKLNQDIRDIKELYDNYERLVKNVERSSQAIESFDTSAELDKTEPTGYKGDKSLYCSYIDFAREVSLIFHFDFLIKNNDDYVITSSKIKIPFKEYDPTNFLFISSLIANEILSVKMEPEEIIETPQLYISDKHFECFKKYYIASNNQSNYRYIRRKDN